MAEMGDSKPPLLRRPSPCLWMGTLLVLTYVVSVHLPDTFVSPRMSVVYMEPIAVEEVNKSFCYHVFTQLMLRYNC